METVQNLINTLSAFPSEAPIILEDKDNTFLLEKAQLVSINDYSEIEPNKQDYFEKTGEEFPPTNQEIVLITVAKQKTEETE